MTKRLHLDTETIRKLYKSGKTIEYLSKKFECSNWSIFQRVKDITRSRGETLIGNKRCLGRKQTKDEKLQRSISNLGRVKSEQECENISKGKKGKKNSLRHRINMSLAMSGDLIFTGFKRSEIDMIRHSTEYKEWRLMVFGRDDFICQRCGKRGCYLEAHHIKSFAEYKDLRFCVDNGITYCKECHCIVDEKRQRFVKK